MHPRPQLGEAKGAETPPLAKSKLRKKKQYWIGQVVSKAT